MKIQILLLLVAAILFSCDRDESPLASSGSVSFIVTAAAPGAGRTSTLTPEKLVVSIEDTDGKTIVDSKVLTLTFKEHSYATEPIVLERGNYRVTKYLVISGETAIYATPQTGAQKASLIEQPLPLSINVSSDQPSVITPNIIGISSKDSPQLFGYTDFGYNLPTNPGEEFMAVRVRLEMYLGKDYYPNIDASFKVKGYNQANVVQWEKEFGYTGPYANDLRIKNGFHHYSIETSKWGKTLSQNFIAAELWEGRVREGTVPLTRVFQATVAPRKVSQYVTSILTEENGVRKMVPTGKVSHEYSGDKISKIRYYRYTEVGKTFVLDSESEFTWSEDNLVKIENRAAGQTEVQARDLYSYDASGRPNRIQHTTGPNGVSTEVTLSYKFDGRVINTSYVLSNGASYQYEFVMENGSIKTDKSTRGEQLCSTGTFTTDKNVNPLKHLGYVDFLMRNQSVSNRLTEDVQYVGCSFPTLVAESYDYVYDSDGYPLKSTTNYVQSWAKTQIEYTYE